MKGRPGMPHSSFYIGEPGGTRTRDPLPKRQKARDGSQSVLNALGVLTYQIPYQNPSVPACKACLTINPMSIGINDS